MNRHELITGLSGAAAWPLASRTQQPSMPVIGFLSGASSDTYQPFVTAFKEGLKQTDPVEGRRRELQPTSGQCHRGLIP
jgi:putative ABC transport system substrate-binding protein